MAFSPPERHVAAPTHVQSTPERAADALVELIREAGTGVVVVVGPRNSGKTEFIRNHAVPRLRAAHPTLVFDCALAIPSEVFAAIAEQGVVILDSFDRFLHLPPAVRDPHLEALLVPRRHATVVLVAEKQCLADLLTLRKHAPDILDHIYELEELTLANELPHYSPAPDTPRVEWDADIIDAVETDLARFVDSTVTPALIAIIYEGFQHGAYDPKRGVVGLLERHLEISLARIATETGFIERDVLVARALLKEIATAGTDSTTLALEVARRMDVPDDEAERCKRWLINHSGLLRDVAGDDLVFQPPQLRPVLEMWVHDDRTMSARAERHVADGLETRARIGVLLAPGRFDEIHAQQLLLKTTPEQAAFLARCALQNHPDANPGPVGYWFRRIADPTLETGMLVEALADPCPKARARAALMLGAIDEPRVHGHLCRLVLEDPAATVRQQGIESLSRFLSKGPIRDVLTAAAEEGPSETRVRAIDALRMFRDEDCARLLQTIVSIPVALEVRDAAIQTLARTQSRAGTLALVRIALDDPDLEDRNRARAALSRLESEDLTNCGLNATLDDWAERRPVRNGRWWKKFGHWPAVTALLLAGFFVHGLPLLLFRRWLAGGAFFAVQIASSLLLGAEWSVVAVLVNYSASIVVAAVVARKNETAPGTFYRALSNALLANTMISAGLVFHGLGHWITGRKRQGWLLMGAELVAVIAILPTFYLENLFNIAVVRNSFDSMTVFLLSAYRLGLVVSWLWSVSSLAVAERWGRKGPWLSERHTDALRALLNAPAAALVLHRKLLAPDPDVSRARMLLKHFGDGVDGEALLAVVEDDLVSQRDPSPEILACLARFKNRRGYETVVTKTSELFDRLPAGKRTPVFRVLVQHPTDASVRSLWERRTMLRPRERVRRLWAAMVLPFRDWHWTVWLAGAAGALLAMLLIVDAVRTSINPGWPEIKELRRLSRNAGASSDVATVAAFLANRHPLKSITELATLLQEMESSSVDPAYPRGIEAGLGIVATFQASEDSTAPSADAAVVKRRDARAAAVQALVNAALDPNDSVRTGAMQALQDAARRKGSPELVSGLGTLFDEVSKGARGTKLAPRHESLSVIAAMLRDVAQPAKDGGPGPAQLAAAEAIAARAYTLAELLLSPVTMDVKQTVLNALQTSTAPVVIGAIKNVILSDRVPVQRDTREKPAPSNAQQVRAPNDLARQQQMVRAMAVEALGAIGTQQAFTALLELTIQPDLPLDIRAKVRHVAAQKLNDQAQRALEADEVDRAVEKARSAIWADPTFAKAHGTLGAALYRQKREDARERQKQADEALKEFEAATKLDKGDAWAYYMQGVIRGSRAEYAAAQNAVKTAILTDPSYPWSYGLLADLYHSQKRDQDAAKQLAAYQLKYPRVPEIYSQLAFVHHERLAPRDPASYEKAYQANRQLLTLIHGADAAQVLSTEMNLLECSLTTGRYQEVLQRAPELLTHLRDDDADNRLVVHLLKLAAEALSTRDRDALTTLDETRRIYDAGFKSHGKWHNWVYDGTVHYVATHDPADARTAALAELIGAINRTSTASFREEPGRPPAVSGDVFDRLRAALEAGGQAAPVPAPGHGSE